MRNIITERFVLLFGSLIVLISAVSCSNSPKDYPKVYPCTITVTKEGTPISGCELTLIPSTGGSQLAIGAVTDSKGVASFQTALGKYAQTGVPDGTWKVLVKKPLIIEDTKSKEELAAMTKSQRDKYLYDLKIKANKNPQIVPYLLGSSATTPIEIQMAGQKTDLTIDVAEYKDTPEVIRNATYVAPPE